MRKKSTSTSRSSDNSYVAFLKSVRPIGLGLIEGTSKLDRTTYGRLMDQEPRPARTISTEYHLVEASEDYFDATATFSLVVVEKKQTQPALLIRCVYTSHFHCEKGASRDLIERFVRSEFRLVTWPYFRAYVSDMCGKMSIYPITIPLSTDD
jgi:hypothetical protein